MNAPDVNISPHEMNGDISDNVADVLEFICNTLYWPAPGNEIALSPDSINGLAIILSACACTLKRIR